mmetsp:Transcript_19520/g.39538  ORF Transcript_19520/g.39538 Transcript_19520/m.39538 type:complete len:441 (-) Transcript_19520:315-1637(-)
MDSWTDPQLKLMKCGGNQKCATYLASKGVPSSTPIKAKYESDAAQLYKEVLKARAEGRPEPTELKKKAPRAPASGGYSGGAGGAGGGAAAGKAGEDPNGMERLTGETDEQYVARQTRLRDEAKARMAAKFGGGGGGGMGGVGSGSMGGGGGGRMGGIGSDSSYNPATGGYGSGGGAAGLPVDVNAVTDSLVSGFGAAFGALGSAARTASTTASTLVSDPSTQQALNDVRSTAGGFWGSLTAGATSIASAVTAPDDTDDGLAELQRQFHTQRDAHPSKYAGFGSDSVSGGGIGGTTSTTGSMSHTSSSTSSFGNNTGTTAASSAPSAAPSMAGHLPGEDPNGIERLSGETDDQYVARQTRLRDEARARMAAKFGGGGMGGVGSGSSMGGYGGGGAAAAPAPTPVAPKPTPTKVPSAPSSNNSMHAVKQKMGSDDFFANFGT